MRELIGQLSVVDDDAASALRVIAHFDALIEQRAGLQSFVRAAAALSGVPAGLKDSARPRVIRIQADGTLDHSVPDLSRFSVRETEPGSGVHVWLETPQPPTAILTLVLERFVGGVRSNLDRTRRQRSTTDAVRLTLDADADAATRHGAARQLGLSKPATVIVVPRTGAPALDEAPLPTRLSCAVTEDLSAVIVPTAFELTKLPDAVPTGISSGLSVVDLPTGLFQATLALRLVPALTAPGHPPHLAYARLGALATIAAAVRPVVAAGDPDVRTMAAVATEQDWALDALRAVVHTPSLRQAASACHVHHSTMQDRVAWLEGRLGYPLMTPAGRHRAATTLILTCVAQA